MTRLPSGPSRGQRGVASLVVVAVLFFVLSLAAAYTNRSLIFEQRTSANLYRATQAFEAAEAGAEWALSMLNSGRIDDDCAPSTDVTSPSFRQRYLSVDATTGLIRPAGVLSADQGGTVWASCVFDGGDWRCSCPRAGPPDLDPPAGAGVFPAFRVRFVTAAPARPGIVRMEVNGCTRLDDACLDFPADAVAGEGRAIVRQLIALNGGVNAPPVAAITVRGAMDAAGAGMGIYNADPSLGGLTIQSGGALVNDGSLRLGSAPGAPAELSVVQNDAGLQAMPDGVRLFTSTFSTWPEVYRDQPGVLVLDCSTACNADDVRSAASRNPGRVIWAEGALNLDAGGDVGSAADPLLIVATGDISVDVPFFGLLYGRSNGWSGGAAGEIHGAAMAEGDFNATGATSFSVIYDADLLARLRRQTGSYVRVPGGWKDF
jgi:hypothetical protein